MVSPVEPSAEQNGEDGGEVFRSTIIRFMGSFLFPLDLLTGLEPAWAPERELSQLAALRQATPLDRFSARANIRAAVWDKPRSSLRRPEERWFMESCLFLRDLPTAHEPRDWSAGLRPGSILRPDTNAPGRRPALRFTGRADLARIA
jgi:hypothetical protein